MSTIACPKSNHSIQSPTSHPHVNKTNQTGEGRPGYSALLAEALKAAGAEEGLEAVLLTHHHYDHVGGLHQVWVGLWMDVIIDQPITQ